MNQRDILRAIRVAYVVCTDTGAVRRRANNRPVRPYVANDEGHLYVRLYFMGRRKSMAVHRLVWMAATGVTIPYGFEIHHRDEDTQNNQFSNLLCLHRLDHQKFHENVVEVPF